MKPVKLDIEAICQEFFEVRGPMERETIIRRVDDERVWTVWTDSPSVINRLVQRGWVPTRPVAGGQLRFELPKSKVSFRSLRQTVEIGEDGEEIIVEKKRQVSDAQVEAFKERMKALREATKQTLS